MLEKSHGPAQRLNSANQLRPEIRGLQMGVDLSLQPLCIGGQGPKVALEMHRTMAWVPGQSVYFPQDAWCPNKAIQNIAYPKRDTPNTLGERHNWDMINAILSLLVWETLKVCAFVFISLRGPPSGFSTSPDTFFSEQKLAGFFLLSPAHKSTCGFQEMGFPATQSARRVTNPVPA